jgi:diguanylate cyclase (GGDEF)-like protein
MRKGRFAGLVRSLSPGGEGEFAASRSDGFVHLAEEQGAAWFWETDAHAVLTYISPGMAALLRPGEGELVGRPWAELLLVEQRGEDAGDRPTLGFHMEARFPFSDVAVTPNVRGDRGWLLSGTPSFDEVGRFLGFRGFGTPLTLERGQQAEAARQARFDSLTGLPNRAHIEALLDEAIANSERRKQSCALFLIDLDRFKQVNDTLGHPAGDVLLQRVAERLGAVLGGDGQAGRLGGDEFQAVFPGISEEGRLASIADRLIETISQPYLIHGHKVAIGASVGIAISRPGRTYRQALIKEADLALYSAKRAGRGTSRFFEPEMHAQENDRRVLESDLKSAVAKGQLKLLFQPIVSVATETVVGFEALVRWSHPTRGPLPPSDFLAIAEASGQMPVLGEWILRAACDEAASWPVHLRLAVNVTKGSWAPASPPCCQRAATSGLAPPRRLDLEVQEAVLLGEDPAARRMRCWRRTSLGVALSLDDFGCGRPAWPASRTCRSTGSSFTRPSWPPLRPRNARARTLGEALMRLGDGLGMQVTRRGRADGGSGNGSAHWAATTSGLFVRAAMEQARRTRADRRRQHADRRKEAPAPVYRRATA